jgi:hypothetical protein
MLSSWMFKKEVHIFTTVLMRGLKPLFFSFEEVKSVSHKEESLIFGQVDRSVSELLIGNTGRVSKTGPCIGVAALESLFHPPSNIHVHPLAL